MEGSKETDILAQLRMLQERINETDIRMKETESVVSKVKKSHKSHIKKINEQNKRLSDQDKRLSNQDQRLAETEALLNAEQGTKKATKSGATNPPDLPPEASKVKKKEENEEETLPESTTSFYFISKYPCIKDNDGSEKPVEGKRDCTSHEYSQNPGSSEEGSNEPIAIQKPIVIQQEQFGNSTLPLFYALFTSIVQLFVYVIVLINITREGLDFPVGVDVTTRIASFLAIGITVYTQNDFFDGVKLLLDLMFHREQLDFAPTYKLVVGIFFLIALGLLGIFSTFILVMQSTEVVELLLGFTAMEFVSALDGAFFLLAQKGYIGQRLQVAAVKTKDTTYRLNPHSVAQSRCAMLPHFLLWLLLLILWITVISMQDQRGIGDNAVVVQLSDEIIPALATLSGTYYGCKISPADWWSHRNYFDAVVYTRIEKQKDCRDGWSKEDAAFFYCTDKKIRGWVFAMGDAVKAENPCAKENWSMISKKAKPVKADAYDLLSHTDEFWFVTKKDKDNQIRQVASDIVIGKAKDLKKFLEAPNKKCEVLQPTGLAFDHPFYKRLPDAFVPTKLKPRGRPVFYNLGNKTATTDGDFILFNGRRWILVKENAFGGDVGDCLSTRKCGEKSAEKALQSCLKGCLDKFDPFKSDYKVTYISDPMALRSSGDTWIPTSELRWHRAVSKGNSTKPKEIEKGLFEQLYHDEYIIEMIENTTDVDGLTRKEAKDVFLASSGLKCYCHKDSTECAEFNCSNGKSLWIEVGTGRNAGLNGVGLNLSPEEKDEILQGIPTTKQIENAGYFNWSKHKDGALLLPEDSLDNHYSLVRYTTCIPNNECVSVFAGGYGISFPGRIKVHFGEEQKIHIIQQDVGYITECSLGDCQDMSVPTCDFGSDIGTGSGCTEDGYDGWVDSFGDGCEWYELYDEQGCPNEGDFPGSFNVTANEACCHCQGTAVPTPSPPPSQIDQ